MRPGSFWKTAALAAVAALVTDAGDAAGQVRFGVGGGPVTAVGDFGDPLDRGFHGEVLVDLGLPLVPLGLRGSVTYMRLPAADAEAEDYTHFAGTVNARLDLLPIPFLDAYVTAGVGLYSSDYGGQLTGAVGRETERGINVGVGAAANLVFVRPFAELRYHRVLDDPSRSFVPLTVGVMLF